MTGSVHVYFSFSVGLREPITVPAGLLAHCQEHVRHVEQMLGLELDEPYRDNPRHWKARREDRCEHDEVLCIVAKDHNAWIRWLHESLGQWASEPEWWKKPLQYGHLEFWRGNRPLIEVFGWGTRITEYRYDDESAVPINEDRTPQTEVLTPKQAATFWHGLEKIRVPVGRWTREFYRDRMDHLYEVLRGREHEGASVDCDPLTTEQAAAVVWLLDEGGYIPGHGLDLDVPHGHDSLKSSYDGGYTWCTVCGAVDPDDLCEHMEWCEDCSCYTGPGSDSKVDGEHDGWCEHVHDREAS